MKSDLTKMFEWFYTYIIELNPPQSQGGGYVEDVTHNGDEDKPKDTIEQGYTDQSSKEEICSQVGMTGLDIRRFHTAFEKITAIKKANEFKANQTRIRMSDPFQNQIITLIELEDFMKQIKEYDPVYGDTIPDTNLITYMDK